MLLASSPLLFFRNDGTTCFYREGNSLEHVDTGDGNIRGRNNLFDRFSMAAGRSKLNRRDRTVD